MTPQSLAADLIRVFEGCRLTSYQDSGGVWTVGFGHTGPDVGPNTLIDYATAVKLLSADALPLFNLVSSKPPIAQAALVSFGYNCGRHSLELVLTGLTNMLNFTHDRHGNALPGLVSRRNLESALIEAASGTGTNPNA